MSRKLIHTIRALTVSLGLLASGLMLGTHSRPAMPIAASGNGLSNEVSTGGNTTAHSITPVAKPILHRHKQARDAMALPFFSFAQVLRRGNGS